MPRQRDFQKRFGCCEKRVTMALVLPHKQRDSAL